MPAIHGLNEKMAKLLVELPLLTTEIDREYGWLRQPSHGGSGQSAPCSGGELTSERKLLRLAPTRSVYCQFQEGTTSETRACHPSSTLRVKQSPSAGKERGGRRRGSVYPAASFVNVVPFSNGLMRGENGQSRSRKQSGCHWRTIAARERVLSSQKGTDIKWKVHLPQRTSCCARSLIDGHNDLAWAVRKNGQLGVADLDRLQPVFKQICAPAKWSCRRAVLVYMFLVGSRAPMPSLRRSNK